MTQITVYQSNAFSLSLAYLQLEGTEGRKEFIFTKPPPRSILPYYRNPKSVKLLDLHPLEVARQLTLIEAELFRNIRPRECLNQAWNKDPDRAPNILAMIDRFNMVRYVALHEYDDHVLRPVVIVVVVSSPC